MLLGYFLEDANKVVSSSEFSDAAELTPIMQAYVAMLQQAQTLESQFEQIRPDVARKLEVITRLIQNVLSLEAPTRFSQTLQMAIEGLQGVPSDSQATEGGLLARYNLASESYFKPYILNRAHIFENYLVNLVVTSLFPFTRGSYLDLYRELVFNVSILQVLLVGVATKHRGMNDELIVEVFHGYARKSDHDKRHLHNLANALCASNRDSFFEVMWMLRDAL